MGVKRGLLFGLVSTVLVLGPFFDASAARISGRASTVVEWFDDANEKTVVPAYQYVQFNAYDLADKGYDFRIYGRVGDDLAGFA